MDRLTNTCATYKGEIFAENENLDSKDGIRILKLPIRVNLASFHSLTSILLQ